MRVLCFLFAMQVSFVCVAESRLKAFLNLHNQERAALDLPDMEWSLALQETAQQHANRLAFEDKLAVSHSGEGENSWAGTNNEATFAEIFALWRSGKDKFMAEKPTPDNCKDGEEQCTSYSQIVWSATTHIGCAAAASPDNDFIVCHYSPAGNVPGQTAY